MTEETSPVWHPMLLSPYDHPDNLPEIDGSALSNEQKEQLKQTISKKRTEDLRYLSAHPEIRGIIREFLQQLIDRMPPADLLPQFVEKFFSQPKHELQSKVRKHVRKILKDRNKSREDIYNSMEFRLLGLDTIWEQPTESDRET